MQNQLNDAAGPQEKGMSSKHEDIAREVADLKREVQELKARLNMESGQRAVGDNAIQARISLIESKINL